MLKADAEQAETALVVFVVILFVVVIVLLVSEWRRRG
jgi:hypothetical protein